MTTTTEEGQALQGLVAIPVGQLRPSPNNPRERLDDIDALAASIREGGLIQPIIAQRIPGHTGLQIVAGHRRYAAVLKLGWPKVPVIVRRDLLPDEELLAMLVENGQRAGLDPIEEARAYRKLKAGGFTDAGIGRKVGRSQSHVSSRLALLLLPAEDQEELRAGVIGITAATTKARTDSGRIRPRKHPTKSPVHLGILHELAPRAKARCQRLGHKSGHGKGVGGVACGECWESVIRADERQHLNDVSEQRGRCVLCDTANDPDRVS